MTWRLNSTHLSEFQRSFCSMRPTRGFLQKQNCCTAFFWIGSAFHFGVAGRISRTAFISSIRWVVLRPVILFCDGVCAKIQEQPDILCRKIPAQDLRKMIIVHNFSDDNPCACPECTAPLRPVFFFREDRIREEFQKVLIGLHDLVVGIGQLPDCLPGDCGVPLFRQIYAATFVLHIYGISFRPIGDFPFTSGTFTSESRYMVVLLYLVGIPTKYSIPRRRLRGKGKSRKRLDFA